MMVGELLNIMNIYDVEITSDGVHEELYRPQKVYPKDRERIINLYGNYRVKEITNVCHMAVTIHIA